MQTHDTLEILICDLATLSHFRHVTSNNSSVFARSHIKISSGSSVFITRLVDFHVYHMFSILFLWISKKWKTYHVFCLLLAPDGFRWLQVTWDGFSWLHVRFKWVSSRCLVGFRKVSGMLPTDFRHVSNSSDRFLSSRFQVSFMQVRDGLHACFK